MTQKVVDKKNTVLVGVLAGIMIPLITIIIYYLFENPTSFSLFVKQIFMGSTYTRIFGLCIVPNFITFYIFRYRKQTKAAEGVSIVTLMYLMFIVIMKFI